MRVAFLGLGVMGGPMAGHLAAAGHAVHAYNRTASRAAAWCRRNGGTPAPDPRAAVERADAVLCCLGDDPDVRDVLLGAGVLEAAPRGALVIDHTTGSADLARELDARCSELGLRFVDAPVSGGQAGAERGAVTVMAGGRAEDVAAARPLLEAYARRLVHIGAAGSGQLAKMVNQICIAGVLEGLAEGLHFALAAGLDPAPVIEAISQGAAQSWQLENRWQTMVDGEFDHGFAVEWMRKDLRIALAEARRNGAALPVTAHVDQLYAEVEALGGRRWDTSSLMARLERLRRDPAAAG
jgi:3-hydroxyisobutyrate dehydrogenase